MALKISRTLASAALVALAGASTSLSGLVAAGCSHSGGGADTPDGQGGDGNDGNDGNGDGGTSSSTGAQSSGTGGIPLPPGGGTDPPVQAEGWSDFGALLVESDGSQALGNSNNPSEGRDQGSKIVFFNLETGDNESAEAYFWDGENIIDRNGSTKNDAGDEYGTDPFEPNEDAIKAFHDLDGNIGTDPDPRIKAGKYDFGQLAGGFPDWYMFRRGQAHTDFKQRFEGGRSPDEPMVIGGYGPKNEGRAVIQPRSGDGLVKPLESQRLGQTPIFYHIVLTGLDIIGGWSATSTNEAASVNADGEPSSAFVEDCAFTKGPPGSRLQYLPMRTTIRRTVVAFSYDSGAHNQGYYTAGGDCGTTFEEVIFYKNGYNNDPRLNADPVRDQFSRNVYQGGGARMGHTYRGIISADGASGGPQMRLGGLMENSLVVEGYWFSATDSNHPETPWETLQEGQSALVRNNVQLILKYPTEYDPDSDGNSVNIAQYGGGYQVGGASFGVEFSGNILSGAMLVDELGDSAGDALGIIPGFDTFPDGNVYTLKDLSFTDNIVFQTTNAIQLQSADWTGVAGIDVSNNTFVVSKPVNDMGNAAGPEQLSIHDNKFYASEGLPDETWVGEGNEVLPPGDYSNEGWPDPRRTLKGYVTEKLGLELLDWEDDPYLDPAQADALSAAGETYDPTGLKTFMAIAVTMRYGGTWPIPEEGKPVVDGDYVWDERFTGTAVVNWIREGFGLDPVD